jgi:hypothetical protein
MPRPTKTWREVLDELRTNYEVDPKTGCWIWTGATFEHGAGRICYQGKAHQAHRLQWHALTNEWPEKVRRACGNAACISPRHLRAPRKAGAKQSLPNGGDGTVKMTVPLVRWIREQHGEGFSAARIYREICKRFGIEFVSESAVRDVCSRRTWPEIN